MTLWRSLLLVLVASTLPFIALADDTLVYRGEQSLFEDTIWSGKVLVDGILTVASGVTLEIRPGTQVSFTRFDSNGDDIGEHEIFSQGTIKALGTPGDPVLFTSAETTPRPGDWGAVNMMVSEGRNLLENCIVEYGYRGFHAHFSQAVLKDNLFRANMRGAQFQESQVVIDGSRFIDNINGVQFRDSKVTLRDSEISGSQWGLRCVYSELKMTANVIEDNLINGVNIRDSRLDVRANRIVGNRRGLYLQRSEGQVVGNDLSTNSEHGIFLEESTVEVVENRISGNGRAGVRWLNSKGRLVSNLIMENGAFAIINDGKTAVDARNNWWGSAISSDLAAATRDGMDRAGLGLVDNRDALKQPLPFVDLSEIP